MDNEFSKEKTVCVTGLRRNKLNWTKNEYNKKSLLLKDIITENVNKLIDKGYTNFLCGMANGSDLIFAQSIIDIKENNKNIILQAIIPFVEQENMYNDIDKLIYEDVLSKCDIIRVIEKDYSKDVYKNRNKYMIDKSSVLIAITYDLSLAKSGTTQTVNFAKKSNVQIININPIDFNTSYICDDNSKNEQISLL